jgi:predicted PurR-regulated permease PerM
MIEEGLRLSPLDERHASQLVQRFGNVSRAVVIASLAAAVVQGILAGTAFVVAGIPLAFLLTALTMLLAMIPFLGAAAVWIPTCLWLFLYEGRTTAAVLLALYCAVIVSLSGNVVKPLVLHGHSNPLLALLSVLGGVTTLGPVGILVGPLAVSFLQALLVMLRTELEELSEVSSPVEGAVGATSGTPAAEGAAAQATPQGGNKPGFAKRLAAKAKRRRK